MTPKPSHLLAPGGPIRLPQSSSRLSRGITHLRLLRDVREASFLSIAFEGPVLKPGSCLAREKLGANPVILECAGPTGSGQYRDTLWILWRFVWKTEEWTEIARAQSRDASWTFALREPALAALHPQPELFDIGRRAHEIAADIMRCVDGMLVPETGPVKLHALSAVYDQLAGRVAQQLSC